MKSWRERVQEGATPDYLDESAADAFVSEIKRRAGEPRPMKSKEESDAQEREHELKERAHAAEVRRAAIPGALRAAGVPERIIIEMRRHDGFFRADTPPHVREMADLASAGRSLYLHGSAGAGKSHLAAVAMWKRIDAKIAKVASDLSVTDGEDLYDVERKLSVGLGWVEWSLLLRSLREGQRDGTAEELADKAATVRWLVLDDISAVAHLTPFAVQELTDIIRARWNANLTTVMTANMSLISLASMINGHLQRAGFSTEESASLSEPVVSRMRGMAGGGEDVVALDGPDLRDKREKL